MSTNKTEKEFKLSSWAIENKMTIYVTMIMFLFLGLSAFDLNETSPKKAKKRFIFMIDFLLKIQTKIKIKYQK